MVTSACDVGIRGQKGDELRSCRRQACCSGPLCPGAGHSLLGIMHWPCPPRLGTLKGDLVSGLCKGGSSSAAAYSTAPLSQKPLQGGRCWKGATELMYTKGSSR